MIPVPVAEAVVTVMLERIIIQYYIVLILIHATEFTI